ncbi:Uncharacterized protein T310_1016 [Rasamsonia emersonii CBS 393.64]|uniref:Xylanolytic transcriptional activator regulatory domain-containing protein n=1 Tax=Rasamsonia emersonii (strain ATCC 16479 / CBS 393.64 / IMI 116815) TaxID=1408163 RepID=A0A0F4Z354_RASE3|nr:Uncharacterized protein T310_1016 [Rasamsonia emersonii CBS 393.64]KKA24937.1 Uncharacterized protein T310_1016 [Rasamsonia emersonii CBS 393.64]
MPPAQGQGALPTSSRWILTDNSGSDGSALASPGVLRPTSNSKAPLRYDTLLTYQCIVKSYEALIQNLRPKLENTERAALDLTLTSIHRRLPDDLAQQIRSQNTEQPAAKKDRKSATYVGKASDIHFFNTIRECIREQEAIDLASEDRGGEPCYDQTDIPENPISFGKPLQFPSREEAARYLDIYFSTIHVAYPFLRKATVLAHFERMWSEEEVDEQQDRPWLALLNFIFAIGSYYMSFPHDEKTDFQPHFQYFEQGLYFSNELMASCTLTNVWILLVQCFFLLAVCQTDSCWNTLGFAIRMGQSIGLHVENPLSMRGPEVSYATERELRRRTWYSMYVLDRLLALQLGRPMAIHEEDFNIVAPSRSEKLSFHTTTDADSSETEDPTLRPSMMDYFINVIQFSHIVGWVIRELYQPTQVESSPDKMLSSASSLDRRLSEWKARLPRHLRFDLGHTFEKSIIFQRQRNNDAFMALFQRDSLKIKEAERICVSEAQQTAHLLHNVVDEKSLVHDFPWWQMISCLICASSILFVAETFFKDNITESGGEDSQQLLREDAETCLKVFEALSVKSAAAKKAVDMLQGLRRLRSLSKGMQYSFTTCTWLNNTSVPTLATRNGRRISSSLPRADQVDDSSCTPCPTEPSDYAPLFSPSGMSTGECWQWPSEISSTMEWSVQFLNPAYMAAQPFAGADGDAAPDAENMLPS